MEPIRPTTRGSHCIAGIRGIASFCSPNLRRFGIISKANAALRTIVRRDNGETYT